MNSVHADPDIARLLELSDALDVSLQLRVDAWREGYDCGRADGEEAGYLRAVAEMKRLHREMREALALELRRWPPGGRRAFANPRPGDRPCEHGQYFRDCPACTGKAAA